VEEEALEGQGEEASMIRLLYKPWSILFGVVGGLVASRLFTKLWALLGDEQDTEPTERQTSWKTVVPAAALEGAIYAGVKAAAQRGSAQAFAASTGVWPGKDQQAAAAKQAAKEAGKKRSRKR
jgi:hypothetical protein